MTDEPTIPVVVASCPSELRDSVAHSIGPGFLMNEAETLLVAKLLHRLVGEMNNDNIRELVGGEDEIETLVRLYVRMGAR